MANVTRIKAKDPTPKKPKPEKKSPAKAPSPAPAKSKAKPEVKTTKKTSKKVTKQPKSPKKPMSKPVAIITWPFRTIAKPFIALGRYIKASWHEIRQVRWPNRKATWKMTGAILVYAALIMIIILLLDALFTFIFNNILGA